MMISHVICFIVGSWFGIGVVAILKAGSDDERNG